MIAIRSANAAVLKKQIVISIAKIEYFFMMANTPH
jgi:hypothetical protein